MNSKKSFINKDRMLPELLEAVLSLRDSNDYKCPPDIVINIENLKFVKAVYYKPQASKSPIHNSGANNSNNYGSGTSGGCWRSRNTDVGFRANMPDVGNISIRRIPTDQSLSSYGEDSTPRRYPNKPQSPYSDGQISPYPGGGRYVSNIISDKPVEDRIIGHIRAKLNKFSHNNYDSIKSFLEQIMTSSETKFISEFMDLLFTKAASENIYCSLYARLLSELTEKFPHLKLEISNIYKNFISIFQEAHNIPDQGSDDYKKFLDAQEKKKFRQGYSHFLAEIYNKGLLPQDAMEITIMTIIESLNKLQKDSLNTLVVEEYLVSLSKIITTLDITKSGPYPPYIVNMLDMLKTTLEKPKTETTGYTAKSRFKIMDIMDAIPN
jgi:hypothetical protein